VTKTREELTAQAGRYAEQLNQIADIVCGYNEATFDEIITTINQLKISEKILKISQEALSNRTAVHEAYENLMAELENLSEM